MTLEKVVTFKVYGYKVRIILTDDVQQVAKERFPGANPKAVAFCAHSPRFSNSWIVLPIKTSAATIAHESYHCAMNILRYIGVESFDDEVVAHHLDYLVNEIMKFYFSPKVSSERAVLDKKLKEVYNGKNRATGRKVVADQKPAIPR